MFTHANCKIVGSDPLADRFHHIFFVKMAHHSVSYVLNVVISTAATVVSWSRVYLRPCWFFFYVDAQ